ncbi:MAG: UxaA family hydrolase [Desulfotignum sp.]|nr:UxaA family hydrolase [Desulfotignum sp.]
MIQFLIHEKSDTVAVATVPIKAGETAQGLFMDTQKKLELAVSQDIPLGHKIAIQDHETDSAIIKYGADIGRVSEPIKKGQHVHIHNLKTRRW